MNYAAIFPCDTLNGTGFRVTLFVSGCGKIPKCRSCHNSTSWDFNYGNPFTEETKQLIFEYLDKPYIQGLSILGGEPFDNIEGLLPLVEEIRIKFPNKDIWIWSWRNFEQLIVDSEKLKLLYLCDVLIDGEFIPELKDESLNWCGSSNQKAIDIQESLKRKQVVLYKE